MNEVGLTHISVSVDSIDDTCAQIPEFGGEVLPDTNIGLGCFVRDPDGQLIELLPMSYREPRRLNREHRVVSTGIR